MIYVVTSGAYVFLVTADRATAEEYCRDNGGSYDSPTDHRFDADSIKGRTLHSYVAARSGRWNKSGYTITETELS